MDKIKAKAIKLAALDWPAASPFGREKWVHENWTRYIDKAKEALLAESKVIQIENKTGIA